MAMKVVRLHADARAETERVRLDSLLNYNFRTDAASLMLEWKALSTFYINFPSIAFIST